MCNPWDFFHSRSEFLQLGLGLGLQIQLCSPAGEDATSWGQYGGHHLACGLDGLRVLTDQRIQSSSPWLLRPNLVGHLDCLANHPSPDELTMLSTRVPSLPLGHSGLGG